jgi:pyridoxal phosphate-dependent aminotransferase EpsN
MLREMDAHSASIIIRVNSEFQPVEIVEYARLCGKTHLSPPHIGPAEIEFVAEAFSGNWIAPAGPNLAAFESELAKVSGRSQALAVSSGTAALHLALRVLGVRPDDRVYVSDLTFAASLQPILYQGAVPVLIDSEPATWNMSPAALERRLSYDAAAKQLPKAIVLVHLYGQPADVAAVVALADSYGIPVIEDSAESLGATYGNRPSGSHGRIAAYSFNGNKVITTSGGGALVADSAALIDRARALATQGRDAVEHYQHSEIAYNYRMSNILAGIGRGQLEVLTDRVASRRKIFERYRAGLSDVAGVSFQGDHPAALGSRWLTVIRLDPNLVGIHAYQLMRRLRDAGIETRPGWKPMHMQPLCAGLGFEPHSETEVVSAPLFLQSLCLPSGSALEPPVQDRIIAQVRRILAEG